jgi:hypothetical protein
MPSQDTPTALAVVPIGGLGRAIVNSAKYQANRGFRAPDLVALGIDLIDKDPFAVAPDGTDVTANMDSSLVLLSAGHVRAILDNIRRSRGIPPELEWWVEERDVPRLLDRVPAEAEGSAQEPVITAIALQTDQQLLGARMDVLVTRAREAAGGRTPSYLVVAGLGAGGVGPGALLEASRMLRERVGDDASMSCIVALPDAWMRLGAHASPSVQRHMMAKTAATMRALRDLSSVGWDARWILGAAPNAVAAKPPMTGVAALGGTLVLQMAMASHQFASLRPNWRQLVSADRPFATLGAAVVTLAPADQSARLAHRHAAVAWASTLHVSSQATDAAARRADDLLEGFQHSPEILSIARAEPGLVVGQAHLDSQDQLLRTGGTDQRHPPALPSALSRPSALGVVARAEDVRALCAEAVDQDRDEIAGHLALNNEQALVAMRVHAGALVRQELPATGANIGSDPTRLAVLAMTLRGAEARCRSAAARLLDDADAVNERFEHVRQAQDALQEQLDGLGNRVTRPRVTRCLTAAKELVVAHRWQAATASVVGLYRALADAIGDYRRRLEAVGENLRSSMHREERLHAEAIDRLQVLAGHAHVTLTFPPGGLAEDGFDRMVDQAIRGDHGSSSGRGLSELALIADGDLSNADDWRVLLRYPTKKGTTTTRLDSEDAGTPIPLDVLSTVLATGTQDWRGTDEICADVTMADALGYGVAAEAEALGTALDAALAGQFVDRLTETMKHTTEPSAGLRPTFVSERLPSPIIMVLRDGRPARTSAGNLVSTALAEHKSLKTEDPNAKADSADGTLVVLHHYLGLGLEHFDLMDRAIPDYIESDEPVDTTAAGAIAHQIEHDGWRRGLFTEPRLLSRTVVPLLKDPERLIAAGVLLAFGLLTVVEGERTRDKRKLAVLDSHGRIQARLADADSPAECIVALCTRADHLRDGIVKLAQETIWKVREDNHGDQMLAAAEFRRRIAHLRLDQCTDPIDGADLQLALETLLGAAPDETITISSNPVGGPPGALGPRSDSKPEEPS